MPFEEVGGVRLYYEQHGQGAPGGAAVVLLHGLGSSGDDWPLQVAAFGEHHSVLTLDLRGHGWSGGGGLGYTIRQMAADVAGLLARLDEPPAHVVGLSLGGCVALATALYHPGHVRSLVLVNTFARWKPAGLRGAGRVLGRLWLLATAPMPRVAELVAGGLFPRPEQIPFYDEAVARLGRNPKRNYLAALWAVGAFDARRDLGRLRCPVLIVAGDRDRTVPRAAVEALRQALPQAEFRLVADSGHATPYDQWRVFNQLVLEFVENR